MYYSAREQHRTSTRGNWRTSSDQDLVIGWRYDAEIAIADLKSLYPGWVWTPSKKGAPCGLIHAEKMRRVILLVSDN